MTYMNLSLMALADPTRRAVFESLGKSPQSVGEIAGGLPVSRPAVSQHLKILKEAGLVTDRPEGAKRIYFVNPNGLAELREWIDRMWGEALTAYAAEIEKQNQERGRKS